MPRLTFLSQTSLMPSGVDPLQAGLNEMYSPALMRSQSGPDVPVFGTTPLVLAELVTRAFLTFGRKGENHLVIVL